MTVDLESIAKNLYTVELGCQLAQELRLPWKVIHQAENEILRHPALQPGAKQLLDLGYPVFKTGEDLQIANQMVEAVGGDPGYAYMGPNLELLPRGVIAAEGSEEFIRTLLQDPGNIVYDFVVTDNPGGTPRDAADHLANICANETVDGVVIDARVIFDHQAMAEELAAILGLTT